jgi:epoxide hydrolase-like predicted phosphatase
MIRAVIFDWGGVLIENPAPRMVSFISSSLGVPGESLVKACNEFITVFQRGFISEDDLWVKVCGLLGVEKSGSSSLWGEAFRRAYEPRKEMFALVSALREDGYKVGILSNTEVPAMRYFNEKHAHLFDTAVFSCAEGTAKPEGRIYEIALERLQVTPQEAIFIDDREDFVAGATEMSINTILFMSVGQVKKELGKFISPVL